MQLPKWLRQLFGLGDPVRVTATPPKAPPVVKTPAAAPVSSTTIWQQRFSTVGYEGRAAKSGNIGALLTWTGGQSTDVIDRNIGPMWAAGEPYQQALDACADAVRAGFDVGTPEFWDDVRRRLR